jgi:hypothetical protein
MDCAENGKIDEIIKVEDKIEKYELKDGEKTKHNNRIMKMLKNKTYFKNFLEEFFNLCEIGSLENIVYCSNIKSMTDKQNSNIICKIQDREIFILIKVISNIDTNITYKMFENSLNIIKKWNVEEKLENKRYPIVIPIVIYLGKEKWKSFDSNIYDKINYTEYEKNRINFSYNMININDLNIKNLKNMKSNIAKELINIKINIYK